MRLAPIVSACLASCATACAGGNAASHLADLPQPGLKDQAKCGVTKSRDHPLVVEWPSSDRLALESKTRRGIVPVRYVGCEMSVLDRCTAPGAYRYAAGTPKEDRVVMKDQDDLYGNLPVGAARLEAQLARSGQLTVAMNLVGRYEADREAVRADELAGDCSGATHFVYAATVGAFDFYAGAGAEVSGGVSAGGVGTGGRSKAERESLTRDGDAAACARASRDDKEPPEKCGAVIRIEVVPLGAASSPACPPGAEWDGAQCVGKKVEPRVQCPAGSAWDGAKCAASTDPTCGRGMHFQAGRGCVADVVAPRGQGVRADTTAMVHVPEGDSPRGHVRAFDLDVTPVTTSQWDACRRARACELPSGCAWGTYSSYSTRASRVGDKRDLANNPVTCVSWREASGYCTWAGKRMPSDEEWEYASRGGDGRTYPWGNDPPYNQLCFGRKDEGHGGTCPVGSFPAGPYGLFDMAGNVWELTGWDEAHARLRGGGWYSTAAEKFRIGYAANDGDWRGEAVGFRCAR